MKWSMNQFRCFETHIKVTSLKWQLPLNETHTQEMLMWTMVEQEIVLKGGQAKYVDILNI